MNTIITRHYPASKLPEDLRGEIDPSSLVTVTITQRITSLRQANMDSDEITETANRASDEADVDLRGRETERDE